MPDVKMKIMMMLMVFASGLSHGGVVLEEDVVSDKEKRAAKKVSENTDIPKSLIGNAAAAFAEELRESASSASVTQSESSHSSSSQKVYECKVYCLDPMGSTKYQVNASSRSEAVNLLDKNSYQVCRSAGFGRDSPDSMESHEKQCYEKR